MGNRRAFLGNLAALTAGGLVVPASLDAAGAEPEPASADWDLTWKERITGDFRAVFDCPVVNDGAGLWRAADWKRSVQAVYGDAGRQASSVLVIRHEAIPMVMNDAFWDRHDISKQDRIKSPASGKHVRYNPFSARPDTPERQRAFTLDGFIAGGGIVLACNYAFGLMVSREAKKQKVEFGEAREATLQSLIPGVILQPSGFFAVIEAQRAGCHFFPASA